MSSLLIQFSRFGAVGAIGTAAHYALFLVLVEGAGTDPVAASTAGALLGALVNYVLNRRYTFRSARRHREALPRFLAVAGAGLVLNAGLMLLLVDGLGMHYLPSQVIATLGVLFWNFTANRLWTFGKEAP
ncbi:MAG: GtrA family protein [Pseudomonadota bacterium]